REVSGGERLDPARARAAGVVRAGVTPSAASPGDLSPINGTARAQAGEARGRRKNAGRKPKSPRSKVSHRARPQFDKPTAVHVSLRVALHVWNLRSRRCFGVIELCLEEARERFGLRIIEFSVLGNHLHLIVEADSS